MVDRTYFVLFLFVQTFAIVYADKPCAARDIKGESVVCVCNESYCDDIVREEPETGSYVAYTSSKGGLRFNKSSGALNSDIKSELCMRTITINPDKKYQTITGFGGAVTDAAGINWRNLTEDLQKSLIESYYGDNGLEYNMLRTPIGGSDFSTHAYAYNELPENDIYLTNYSLTYEDYEYKIKMIKAIEKTSSTPVHIIATTWSPPLWMKTNNDYYGSSRLKKEYYQTYADYHHKFVEKYSEEGISIWGITTTNEPLNGVIPWARFNSLGWVSKDMGIWITDHLGPTIRNSSFSNLKILALDDQRYMIPFEFVNMVKDNPAVLDYIDGVGVHYYGNFFTPASVLDVITDKYPEKFIIATEACEGSFPWQLKKVVIGSWGRAENYIHDILVDLNHNLVGWLDWNLCLNAEGGPNWATNFVDSPIIVFPENKEFIKQPMFYAMGHISKFIPRGSVRLDVEEKKCPFTSSVENAAFLTPRNTVVLVLYNSGDEKTVTVAMKSNKFQLKLEDNSITTIEFPYETV